MIIVLGPKACVNWPKVSNRCLCHDDADYDEGDITGDNDNEKSVTAATVLIAVIIADAGVVDGDDNHDDFTAAAVATCVAVADISTCELFCSLTRQALETVTIKGVTIPKDTIVFIPLYNILRDPANFQDPDSFRPDR